MSRYDIDTANPSATACVVGWDNPLQTFFAQVQQYQDDVDEDPIMRLWIGTTPSECLDVIKLAKAIAPWAILPADIATQLEADRDTAPAPSRHQAEIINTLLCR